MDRFSTFFSNLFRRSNIGVIIFFLLNFSLLFSILGSAPNWDSGSFIAVFILYCCSLLLSFSPVGQSLLRVFNGARKMVRIDMRNKILPIAEEVYASAKRKTPGLPNKLRIRIMYGSELNAFAIGTDTICITEGMLDLPENLIAGLLAHEIGHLALQHTVIQILIGGGNLIITFFLLIIETIRLVCTGISAVGTVRGGGVIHWISVIFAALSAGLLLLWTKICMLFLMSSNRANEFAADCYAYEIGYGNELAEALDRLTMGVPQTPLLKILESSHPEPGDRIGKLQALGVSYSRY